MFPNIFLVSFSLLIIIETVDAASDNETKVLLIAVDGFRWDFRNKTDTPHLDEIVKNGVTSEYVINVFPTSTLPNHQSIVTGLYPENHGMVDNTFMDPTTGRIFSGLSGNTGIEWWNQSTPIWTINEIQEHHSGVLFWPGHRVKYEGKLPSYLPPEKYTAPYEPGRIKMPISQRIDTAISWLKKDDVNLVVMYTEEPDDTAHNFAPDSNNTKNIEELENAIQYVDDWIRYLNERLRMQNLTSKVNVILIGDHGHTNTSYLRNMFLDDYFSTKKETRLIGAFTNVFIYTKPGRDEYVYEKLKNATELNAHYKVYMKKDIPEDMHIKNNSRTADILLLPDPGWTATSRPPKAPYLKGKWERGDHGYHFEHRDMNPAFFAYGPSFRKGYQKKCIHTVDVYYLMCHILKLTPGRSDGKFERIKSLLKDDLDEKQSEKKNEIITPECEGWEW